MSQPVLFGSFEPEPEGVRSLGAPDFSEMDKGLALRTHLLHLIFHAEIAEVTFPAVPQRMGELLLQYSQQTDYHTIQQN